MPSARAEINLNALLSDLTEPQREATTHTDGPLLVLAGAGSGKTRVVTRRAGYLAATVTEPRRVLAITFTNKAANEMRERIERLGVGREMTVCTFHSLCARLLRIHHERAGLAPNFTIYDQADSRTAIKEAVRACDFDPKNWPAARIQHRISQAKNTLMTAPQFAQREARWWVDKGVAKIYSAYEQLLAKQQALDFDDLLMKTALLLETDEELRARLEDRYRYLLIDEYQDTNEAQYRIAHLLTRQRRNLCVTGDPDQSIYGWRGANIRNILRFEEDHPDAVVVRLEQNYRSTQRILAAAGELIEANVQRKEKRLWTENEPGDQVRVADFDTADAEAEFIADEIGQAADGGRSLNDVAIFYRINALSLPLELALQRRGIAYQVARGQDFYGRKEIKDLLAYVRVTINPADATSLRRIVNTPPRGIGKTTLAKLDDLAARTGRRLYEVVLDPATHQALGRVGERVARFAELLKTLQLFINSPAADALSEVFSRSGLRASLTGEGTVDELPVENVNALIHEARKYDESEPDGSLIGWLEQTSLTSDVDAVDPSAGKVTLMTLHAAKGLEFPVVYMVGLEDGLLPFFREDDDNPVDEEEERRLCFVGMTRAMKRLTLTHARFRQRRGQEKRSVRSPFLRELPAGEVEWVSPDRDDDGKRRSGPRGLPDDVEHWSVGTLVRHPEFGLGQLVAIRRAGGHTHVGVAFQRGGQETFVLEYADLTRVDHDDVG